MDICYTHRQPFVQMMVHCRNSIAPPWEEMNIVVAAMKLLAVSPPEGILYFHLVVSSCHCEIRALK